MAFPAALGARLAVVLAVALSLALVFRLDDSAVRIAALRSRLLFGVPWATVLILGFVLSVYLFVQDGLTHWNDPLVIPFRAWSYFYPLGVLLGPFAHVSPSHLIGNLVGTLTFAPIAEFAWGHYPAGRDSVSSARPRSLATPIRRVLAFLVAALVVGVLTGLFAIGPIIGFSGVVFAFAGFALVRYPLASAVSLAVGGTVGLLYDALSTPVTVASAQPSFAAPWWAEIAIQGHAFGLLSGVLCGVVLSRRRNEAPAPFPLFVGAVVFAVSQSLWAVYWYRGDETFVLFRAIGTALVFCLAALVAASVAAPDRPLVPSLLPISLPDAELGLTVRRLATLVLVAALIGLAVPAVPANLSTVADASPARSVSGSAPRNGGFGNAIDSIHSNASNVSNGSGGSGGSTARTGPNGSIPNGAVEARGYTVRYAENVPNRLVSVVKISAFGETTAVNTSGVIVSNARREIWTTAVSSSELAFSGNASVRVGGLGWAETIRVERTGWDVTGGNTTYEVFLRPPDGPRRLAYTGAPATATPVLDGKNVSVTPARNGYAIVVSRENATLGRAPVPRANASATVAGLLFTKRDGKLVATSGATTVPIAERETYRGE